MIINLLDYSGFRLIFNNLWVLKLFWFNLSLFLLLILLHFIFRYFLRWVFFLKNLWDILNLWSFERTKNRNLLWHVLFFFVNLRTQTLKVFNILTFLNNIYFIFHFLLVFNYLLHIFNEQRSPLHTLLFIYLPFICLVQVYQVVNLHAFVWSLLFFVLLLDVAHFLLEGVHLS